MMTTTHTDDLIYWLALVRIPYLNRELFTYFVRNAGNISEIFKQKKPSDWSRLNVTDATLKYLQEPDWRAVERDLSWLNQSAQHHIITINDADFPKVLREIHTPPLLLYAKGDKRELKTTQLAMVGSRKPTPTGLEIAFEFSYQLTKLDLAIISGMALGIDSAAHKGAIKAQGKTLAVMGTGFGLIYPKQNQALADQIADQGLLLTEFPFETKPIKENFPRRNRLISGLSVGTLVVEASLHSGSLITAKYANDQGREVFAIPGSIYNTQAKGCHYLIRQGAKLVENIEDILEEIPYFTPKTMTYSNKKAINQQIKLEDNCVKLLECFGFESTSVDILVARSGFPVHLITTILVELESKGFVVNTLGGYTRVRS